MWTQTLEGPQHVGCVEAASCVRTPPHPGGSRRCLRADPAALHVPQPPGAGGARRAAEHGADQPDAQRPQPRGLRQRAGARLRAGVREPRGRVCGSAAGVSGVAGRCGAPRPPPRLPPVPPGAGVVGMSLRGPRGAAAGAGLQADAAAAELPGAVGRLAGRRGHAGAQAVPGQRRLPQGRQALPPQVVLLQVRGGGRKGGRAGGQPLPGPGAPRPVPWRL